METKGYDWGLTRSSGSNIERGVRSVEASPPLAAKIDCLLDTLLEDKNQGKKPLMACDWCLSTNHEISECQLMKEASIPKEQVSFIANAMNNNPYSNTYDPGWRNHPHFLCSSQSNSIPRLIVTLTDHSVISPRGIVEDVLVRMDKFYNSTDLVILDISEDADMPLILGHPSLPPPRP
ncbi:unnamed protein product [Linum trigynum]|uniref:Uncharacterized protein n=1 Tax=Linum trigynum TaxID=586398 RepID=A0AAV2ESA2_9ROSI